MSHISFYTKLLGQRSAGKPHAALDVAGAGDVPLGNAPVFDPTWETKRITAIQCTMQNFLESLNDSLDSTLRSVVTRTTSHPLESRISQADRGFSEETLTWLNNELVHVRSDLPCDQIPAQEFYRGASYGWSPIQQDFDVARSLTDTVLNDCVLMDEVDRTVACDFYLVKGHAGSGKTVVLKRLAWDATVVFSKICLYYADMARIPYDAIAEVAEAVDERIFLFIEHPADHIADLAYLLRRARREGLRITVICAERGNEWNVECGALKSLVTEVYDIRYLSRREIVNLLSKLKQNNCLGLLGGLTEEERIAAFEKKAGRQLLVALHEATLGKPFEDTIYDEFQSIEPEGARRIYLTICTLNRLEVVVRAGVIKRVHGVSFDEFRQKFFLPLESIVQTLDYMSSRDMAYQARHPWIAEVVFERVLKSADERYDLYLQLLDALDIGYEADRRAFRRLIRARDLIALFPDPRLVRRLYEKARETVGEDAYLYQQRAIFEMRRENPNLALAYEYLTNAVRVAPYDKSIVHSLAELEIERSKRANSEMEQGRHLGSAQRLARSLTGSDTDSSYGFHTLCKIGLDELRHELSCDVPSDQSVSECIKTLEKDLDAGLQRFPDDEYLLDSEARLAKLVKDDTKAVQSLERAFRSNPTSPFIAKGLARLYELGRQQHRSRETLEACLETRPGDKGLNAALARLLTQHFPDEGILAEYYWRRSFTEGDANYSNQFWYARQLYVNGKTEEASLAFRSLRGARVAPEVRNKLRGVLNAQDGSEWRFRGRVERLEATYALVSQLDSNVWAFLHRRMVTRSEWEQVALHISLSFRVAFTYSGLAAFDINFVT